MEATQADVIVHSEKQYLMMYKNKEWWIHEKTTGANYYTLSTYLLCNTVIYEPLDSE